MATTQNTYTGNGSTTNYSFTFEYLQQSDVKVTLDEVATTAYTLANATTVAFTTAPANGVAIRIFRETATTLGTTFFPGSAIKAEDLNDNFTQNLYVTQESDTEASLAKETAATAKTTADGAVTTANSAVTTANTASTNATAAVNTANTASTNASAAVSTANTASTNASNAVSTANSASTTATSAANDASTALSTANSAVSTANTASTNATNALNTANSASTAASNAVSTANTASSNATSAVNTANTASTDASNAVSTANTASTNATAALNNSRESDGQGGFTSAISKANTALSTANSAAQAVEDAQVYTPIANLAALPGSPSNEDRVEITNSTGAESSSAITGLPSGFTGSSDLSLRVQYSSSSSKWEFKQYFAVDPEARYYPKTSGEANATAISHKMNTSGGTFTGDVSFDGEIIAKGDSTNAGKITLNCENNSHAVKIKAPPHSAAATYTLTLPNNTGSNGNALLTNGSGTLSWGTPTTTEVTLATGSKDYVTISGQELTIHQVDLTDDVTNVLPTTNGGLGANLTPTNNNFIVGNGTNWTVETPADARTSLGLGSLATQNGTVSGTNSGDVSIAHGYDYISITNQELTLNQIDLTTDVTGDLPVTEGGTGASTESDARTNLGLAIGTDVQAYSAKLAAIDAMSPADSSFIVGNGSTFVLENAATARHSLDVDQAGTDNSTDVTLTGTPDYLSISNQTITRSAINLASGSTHVTGTLPIASGGTGATTKAAAQQALDLEPGVDVQAYDLNTVKSDVATTFTAQVTLDEIKESVFTHSTTTGSIALDPANGSIQTLVLSGAPTFTDSFESGQTIVLHLEGADTYSPTWISNTVWVSGSGNSAPTVTAKDTLVFWKKGTTVYGAYVGSYV